MIESVAQRHQVNVLVELTKSQDENPWIKMAVNTAGMFEIVGKVEDSSIENFAQINGPAILYPFIRETIASITSKAGIPTVLLPPLNFVEMAERNRQSSSQMSQ
ncbi:protein-export chaperone SecB [Siphonobacter sp. SORGH_AS_0500]|uniref:protein-export chaperone SecB n=1 Tax=Siphonobacter sp. SORGH_AS_0500 TaxID=1864824 RepID=UPI0028662F19|nr:protein-export chaperone SecB [Siphonobacter sp. SORGH_AS_0500]MDR6195352.1 preprotein translocase subunit SecB [Siphonobacter sp. SORGH_AS_0500]